MNKKTYSTKQREFLLDFFMHRDACFTVEEIVRHARDAGIAIGQTTVYRNLEKLTDEGVILKFALPSESGACFQAAGCREAGGHFHLICTDCGAVTHLECEHLDDLSAHMKTSHSFDFDAQKTVFYGRCRACKQG